ncbi:DUF948 domain-containing protein [Sporosarcina luteola]|uniref:DUF948 domain-containing protein n=1 Tax=Sporosarcina luteola TaxID=582850 RepID=UPI00203C4C90|nr:DUF948 domain-containing protein [Sporosarcina luteola]MCM3637509.1 DUF948 domain-containing protein [Sporosarcina luteola]
MDWLGIGVLLIGIAFLTLTCFLIKPLRKMSDALDGLKQTTDRLPRMVDDLSKQTAEVMQLGNATIATVNEQVKEVSPFFHIIGDTGTATRKLTLSAIEKMNALKDKTSKASDFTTREKYEGIYGILSFIFFLRGNKDKIAMEDN